MSDLISVVLPIYNGARFLKESVESVVNQTCTDWELLILDDCSTDETPEIALRYAGADPRIRYFRNESNLKLPGNLNKGFSLARGNYLTWTSDDNRFHNNALHTLLAALKYSPEAKRQIVLDKLDYLEKRRARVLARFPSLKQDLDYHYLSMLVILSADPGASEESIKLTQRMLRDYFRREKPCRMEASLRMKLLRLQYAPSARLLKGAGREAAGGHNNGELFE